MDYQQRAAMDRMQLRHDMASDDLEPLSESEREDFSMALDSNIVDAFSMGSDDAIAAGELMVDLLECRSFSKEQKMYESLGRLLMQIARGEE